MLMYSVPLEQPRRSVAFLRAADALDGRKRNHGGLRESRDRLARLEAAAAELLS